MDGGHSHEDDGSNSNESAAESIDPPLSNRHAQVDDHDTEDGESEAEQGMDNSGGDEDDSAYSADDRDEAASSPNRPCPRKSCAS